MVSTFVCGGDVKVGNEESEEREKQWLGGRKNQKEKNGEKSRGAGRGGMN